MGKEQFMAILVGSLLGVGVAFGVWRYTRQNAPETSSKQQEIVEQRSTSTGFSIVSPRENAVVTESPITITGFSPPGSLVGVYSDKAGFSISNSAGEFELVTSLSSGLNNLVVWSFGHQAEPIKTELAVIYTTRIEAEQTDGHSSIYGTVTDITAEMLQIRSADGQIEQVAISSETTYVSTNGKSENIEFQDIAIGDFIAIIGDTENGRMAAATRVLVTQEPGNADIVAVSGNIETLSSTEFFVKDAGGNSISVEARGGVPTLAVSGDSLSPTRLTSATPGDGIVIIGRYSDDELDALAIVLL